MAKVFFLNPLSAHVGLSSVCLGMLRALDSAGLRVGFFKPVAQAGDERPDGDRSLYFAREHLGLQVEDAIPFREAFRKASSNQLDLLMEDILDLYSSVNQDVDALIVEGLPDTGSDDWVSELNVQVARNLNADVILVAAPGGSSPVALNQKLNFACQAFSSPDNPDVVGCILNRIGAPLSDGFPITEHGNPDGSSPPDCQSYEQDCPLISSEALHLVGAIEWDPGMVAPRVSDVSRMLKATVLNAGESDERRVLRTTVCARTLPNMLETLRSGTLIVTPGDREDILIAACMASLIGVPLAGVLLTGNLTPDPRTLKLCMPAMDTGLPILQTGLDTYHTANRLSRMDQEVPCEDHDRIESVISAIASKLDMQWLQARVQVSRPPRLSPAAFRYQLTQRSRAADKLIVLPEGSEPRTVRAAIICHERNIARCLLLAERSEVETVAEAQGLTLPDSLQVISPDSLRPRYIDPMVKIRQHKGLTTQMAEAQLEDTVVLGTMMLAEGDVDGLVSGAVHTTANTVRPALQLIKSRPGSSVVSSLFFMCLPEQVVVYGDCAINPDPSASELADIAIQCADSAVLFGIEPRVAMLSYSTGSSGSGNDVEKVREATTLARARRPDLIIDGPMQYDAAANASVARAKAPDSEVAGRATVFVFPDLNTGNTTYKAVQRSANVISMGPMLQGLKRPVNDLSRGALVDDIVYTIALTAIQATQG